MKSSHVVFFTSILIKIKRKFSYFAKYYAKIFVDTKITRTFAQIIN